MGPTIVLEGDLSLAGTSASSLDLGTSASAGGLTFTGVDASKTAVNLAAIIKGNAVGDTWVASTQDHGTRERAERGAGHGGDAARVAVSGGSGLVSGA